MFKNVYMYILYLSVINCNFLFIFFQDNIYSALLIGFQDYQSLNFILLITGNIFPNMFKSKAHT